MEASGSPTAWSTLLSGSQMARRPRWTLSTSGPRVRAARGASSGRPASPGTWLLIREADDVEREQVMGHPHTAHRDGEIAACQVLASLPDEGAELLDQFVVLAAWAPAPQACFGHAEHAVDPRARCPHREDRDVHVAVDPEQVSRPKRRVGPLPRLQGNHRLMFSESIPGKASSGTPAISAAARMACSVDGRSP